MAALVAAAILALASSAPQGKVAKVPPAALGSACPGAQEVCCLNFDFDSQNSSTVDVISESCSDFSLIGYECVPEKLCHDGTIITDGSGILIARNGCAEGVESCIKFKSDPQDFNGKVTVGDWNFSSGSRYQPACGRRHENGFLPPRLAKRFNASFAQFGEWPHICAVMTKDGTYLGGGSLISPGIVLTTAHSVAGSQEESRPLLVRCGEWNAASTDEPLKHQERAIYAMDLHPEFNPKTLASDWALLYTKPFVLQKHIDTICLPDPGETFDQGTCFTSGWGKNKFGNKNENQVILKEVPVPVVRHGECEATLQTSKLGKRFNLDASFLCAGRPGADDCLADGGSPLVCPSRTRPGTYVQAGIVAWGVPDGCSLLPGVYASVARGVCWVDHAATCQLKNIRDRATGSYASFFGFTSNQCQTWMEEEQTRLSKVVRDMRQRNADARTRALKALEQFNRCTVAWPATNAPGGSDAPGPVSVEFGSLNQDGVLQRPGWIKPEN